MDWFKTSAAVSSIAPMKISIMNKRWTGFSTESRVSLDTNSRSSGIVFLSRLEMPNCGVPISMSYPRHTFHPKRIGVGVLVGSNHRRMFSVFLSAWQIHFLCQKISTRGENCRFLARSTDEQLSCHDRSVCMAVSRWLAKLRKKSSLTESRGDLRSRVPGLCILRAGALPVRALFTLVAVANCIFSELSSKIIVFFMLVESKNFSLILAFGETIQFSFAIIRKSINSMGGREKCWSSQIFSSVSIYTVMGEDEIWKKTKILTRFCVSELEKNILFELFFSSSSTWHS